jgi:hypothetical protein
VKKFIRLKAYFETGMEGSEWIGYDFQSEEFNWVWKFPSIKKVTTWPSLKKSWKLDLNIIRKVYINTYERHLRLENGDLLTIFEDKEKTKVLWKGTICKDTETNREYYTWVAKIQKQYNSDSNIIPAQESLKKYGFQDEDISTWSKITNIFNECFSQQISNNLWCHWIQKGVLADIWGKYFIEERYAYIERVE